ncbi:hypothetical protein G9A89_002796 [Geosiphon pyriformis]|nr:hypothetical protein G9A89_002796 [Geosiphon pyriformis]
MAADLDQIFPLRLGKDSVENQKVSLTKQNGNPPFKNLDSKIVFETKEFLGTTSKTRSAINSPSGKLRFSGDHSPLDTFNTNKKTRNILSDQFKIGPEYRPCLSTSFKNDPDPILTAKKPPSFPKSSYNGRFQILTSIFSPISSFNSSQYLASELNPIAPQWYGFITDPEYQTSKSFSVKQRVLGFSESKKDKNIKAFQPRVLPKEPKFILNPLTPHESPNYFSADLNEKSNSPKISNKTLNKDALRKVAHHFLSPKQKYSKEQKLSVAQESSGVLYYQSGIRHNQKKNYIASQFGFSPRHPEFVIRETSIFSNPSRFGNFWGAVPSRWLRVGNLPKDINLWTLSQLIQTQGDAHDIFVKFLTTHGFVYVIFYDIRDAMKAHHQLQGQSIFGKRLFVQFCARPFSKQASTQNDSEPWEWDNEGVLILNVLGKRLEELIIVKEFEAHGDIRAFKKLQEENKQIILLEYYDTRDGFEAKEMLNGKIIQNATLQVDFYNHDIHSWRDFLEKKHQEVYDHHVTSDCSYDVSGSLSTSADSFNNEICKSSKKVKRRESLHTQDFLNVNHTRSFTVPTRHVDNSLNKAWTSTGLSVSDNTTNQTKSFFSLLKNNDSVKQVDDGNSTTKIGKGPANKRQTGPNNSTIVISGDRSVPAKNALDLENISTGDDNRTTFMIRNIPNKYTQEMLLETLDETHKFQYDFVYLRMDFKNRCNVGYAFINFVCELAYANIQGKKALVEKFRNSSIMDELPEYRPKIFFSKGPSRGKEQSFPPPDDFQGKWRSLTSRADFFSSST